MCKEKGPLAKLIDAIESGDVDFPTFSYKCDKCGRDAQWEYFIGIPLQNIPCGCGGSLVLQKR